MKQQQLSGLRIRTAVVSKPDVGYILACNPKMEEDEIPHTKTFTWRAGTFTSGELNFDAHASCIVSSPEPAWVMIGGHGEFAITSKNSKRAGKIFEGQPQREGYGMFRSVSEIGGKAYAIGMRGMAYRLDGIVKWIRIDDGLSSSFDITAIDGFDGSDIYAAGYSGALWHFDGRQWASIDLPTNANLTSVKCAGDGSVHVAGQNGLVIKGGGNKWQITAEGQTAEDIWDLEWFQGKLYLSTMSSVYRLQKGDLELVDFGEDPPNTCYQLSAAKGVIWSIGSGDIMSFDGKKWIRIL